MFRGKEFVINVQYATMKYDIIRKPMVLEKMKANLLKFKHDQKTNLEMIPYLINSKEGNGKAREIYLKLRLLKDIVFFQTLQAWIGHNGTRYYNLNALRYQTRYHAFSLRFVGFWTICNGLPGAAVNFLKKY